MLLVITIQPTGNIDLNSADVEMTGRAFDQLRPLLHECAAKMHTVLANRTALVEVAAMVEQRADHAALLGIGFTQVAIVRRIDE